MKMSSCFAIAAVVSLFVGLANTSYAGNVAVANADFEDGAPTGFNGGDPSSWTLVNAGPPATYATGTYDLAIGSGGINGTNLGMLQVRDSDGTGALYYWQSLGTADTGKEYTLKVDVGTLGGNTASDYTIELLSGGTVFATQSLANGGSIPLGTTVTMTAVGTPGSAGALTVRLNHLALHADAHIHQGWFDNVDVNAIPEPTAFALAAMCLVGVGAYRRRRR